MIVSRLTRPDRRYWRSEKRLAAILLVFCLVSFVRKLAQTQERVPTISPKHSQKAISFYCHLNSSSNLSVETCQVIRNFVMAFAHCLR